MLTPNNPLLRSPLFYVGDKFKLMPQLLEVFPRRINNFHEPFTGGGTVFLNTRAEAYFLNDANAHLMDIHRYLMSCADNAEGFFAAAENLIARYGLSRSYKEDAIPDALKRQYKKTYIARYNKAGYERLRSSANQATDKDPLVFYLLLIYGFNRMLRFNRQGEFNLPVGNVDFNHNVARALVDYFAFVRQRRIVATTLDFRDYLTRAEFQEGDFLYLDPPYLITDSEYNKVWGAEEEAELLRRIDELARKRVRFALSNVTCYRGRENHLLLDWMKKYRVRDIRSNYINYHDNSRKSMREVLVFNC